MDTVPFDSNGDGADLSEFEMSQFRIVPASIDEGNPNRDAVLAGLDIYDVIELRSALQELIDIIVVGTIDPDSMRDPGEFDETD